MATKKKAEKQAEAQDKQAELADRKVTKEQAEQLGAGRNKEADRVDHKPAKADKGLGFESDTPSALALEKVGNLDGEDVKPGDVEKALEHGEAYQAEKRKHRWG